MHAAERTGEDSAADSLEATLARMARIEAGLRRGDGVRWFNRMYREVTAEVLRRLRAGAFEDPRYLERLAVLFAESYFDAFERFGTGAPADGPAAWGPLFATRYDRRVAPVQFALAGMNAHINFDLAVAVRDTALELAVAPRAGTPQHRDFQYLNEVLAEVGTRVRRWLTPGLLGRLDRALGRLDDVVAGFSMARARDAAWANGCTLWSIRDDAALSAAHLRALERMVGLAGRGLVVPTLLGLSRWAGAQRWLPGPVRTLLGDPRERLPARA